jgi:acetylornithine deacetylase/succinyl-diaminopimelate desuccinylase-like protein
MLEGVELMGASAEERILRRTWYPTLSIVGLGGAPVPEIAGNVLRPSTTAKLSFRLPPSVDAETAREALIPVLTTDVPSSARVTLKNWEIGSGWNSPPLAPWLAEALDVASNDAFGRAPGFTGEGGSIPFLASLGKRYPEVQFVATGVMGPQSNAHAIDEFLDLPMTVGVTNSVITVLSEYAKS